MTIHEQVLQNMKEMSEKFAALGVHLELPPMSNQTLRTRYTEMNLGQSLAAEVPFDSRFTNPLKMYQGGFLCAALDEVFGPLTYMAAEKPVVTIEMSTSFVRPFTQKDETVVIRAEVVAKTRSLLILKAEVKTKDGKLIATATNHSLVVSDQHLKR